MRTSQVEVGGFARLANNTQRFGPSAGSTVMVVAKEGNRFFVETEGERIFSVFAGELNAQQVSA